ncbi:MAG TPA: ABC transporter substrate-binding protein, partial [Lacipirellulaceae bacterium]|nr:ABC transporter substrate-binding protein [Lacipirellulaceae bacterium]
SALVALYDRNPKHPRLATAIQAVSDNLLARRLDERNYAGVRALLDVLDQRVAALELPNLARWRQRLASDARNQLTQARQALTDGDFESAREAARFAYVILPELAEARALMREIQAAAPVIRVAVSESAIPAPSSQTPDWASARIADLVNPTLVEMTGFGAEGGEYGSRFGALTTADSRQETMLRLSPEAMARGILPQAVSARVVAMASADAPEGSQPLAALLRSAKLRDGQEVVFAWRRAHLHPEALLAVPLRRLAGPSGRGLWFEPIDAERPDGPQRYRRQGGPDSGPPGAPQLVVEQIFDDDDAALAALASGEVDALDRVPPWQVEQAKQASGVVVHEYRLPTVHVLAIHPESSLGSQREFRRALCYGIDRQSIVRDILLGGQSRPGFRVLSGPFPVGVAAGDPVGYAYNGDVAPRPYEPRLAALLVGVARTALSKRDGTAPADESDETADNNSEGVDDSSEPDDSSDAAPPAELPPLRLAHGADPVARIACQAIKLQLDAVGIPVTLVPVDAEPPAGAPPWDLRYLELAVREPLVDARRLLGPGGTAGWVSAQTLAALNQLEQAQNWNEARTQLREIHRLSYSELALIPLWQTVNHFGRRTWLEGVGDRPIALYQNLTDWRKEFAP